MFVLGAMAALAAQQAPRAPETRVLVERAAAYVDGYTGQLRFVLADEDSVQRTFGRDGAQTGERRLRGELYLAFLPVDRVWIAVHDISHVDDVPVARDDLLELLRQGEVSAVARRVADRNASFNLGSITRNFNEPTLPLLLLVTPRLTQVRFNRAAVGDAATSMTLAFRERDRPTLVRTRSGQPAYSRGTLTVDAVSGRIEATTLELEADGVRARLDTAYAHDSKIDLWVPTTFRERYERGREVVTVDSAYSNYRRFEVLARIK
jgi:hypothetical protein